MSVKKAVPILAVLAAFLAAALLQAQTKAAVVNINLADIDELSTLPRIGAKVAQRIIRYREEHGAFERIEDLMNVRGIGQKTFERLKSRITVGELEAPEKGDTPRGKNRRS